MNWQRGTWPHGLGERWSLIRIRLQTPEGRFKIGEPIDMPGYKGYPLFEWGEHVSTHRLLRDAKAAAEEQAR